MNENLKKAIQGLISTLLAIAMLSLVLNIYVLFNNPSNHEIVKETFKTILLVIGTIFLYIVNEEH